MNLNSSISDNSFLNASYAYIEKHAAAHTYLASPVELLLKITRNCMNDIVKLFDVVHLPCLINFKTGYAKGATYTCQVSGIAKHLYNDKKATPNDATFFYPLYSNFGDFET